MMPFDWIFFDCFNTLMDDFDETGDDSGLSPMHHLPVAAGFYDSAEAFRQDYHQWRKAQWVNQWREVALPDRLRDILKRRSPHTSDAQISALVAEMMQCFDEGYPQTVRLPPGVQDMLTHWQGKVKMGVVSNFPIAQMPAQLLEQFGLRQYFDFVLDSAALGWKKPSAEIYQAALKLASVSSVERVLFIGDHLRNDVLMPLHLGMQAIYLDRSGDHASSEAAPTHIAAITHWKEFRLDRWV